LILQTVSVLAVSVLTRKKNCSCVCYYYYHHGKNILSLSPMTAMAIELIIAAVDQTFLVTRDS
jgi:hypothetical protein